MDELVREGEPEACHDGEDRDEQEEPRARAGGEDRRVDAEVVAAIGDRYPGDRQRVAEGCRAGRSIILFVAPQGEEAAKAQGDRD